MSQRKDALTALLAALKARDYRFITPTPATHARVLARPEKRTARSLRDALGWSLPFEPGALDAEIESLLDAAGALTHAGDLVRATIRVSELDGDLFLHSAFPTEQADSVFFGPDSYRFARLLQHTLPALGPRRRLVDLGAGSGVGAIAAARLMPTADIVLTDINPAALDLAAINWASAGLGDAAFVRGDGLSALSGDIDLIIANPPYMADAARRTYRDGGALHGASLSLRWAQEAAGRLRSGGAFVLYTGSAIIDGQDRLEAGLRETLHGFDVVYRELDPDVFGEDLERADYRDVERIAIIGAVAMKR